MICSEHVQIIHSSHYILNNIKGGKAVVEETVLCPMLKVSISAWNKTKHNIEKEIGLWVSVKLKFANGKIPNIEKDISSKK